MRLEFTVTIFQAVDMILRSPPFQDRISSINSDNLIKLADRILARAITIHKCCQQPNSQLATCLKPPTRGGPPVLDMETTLVDIRQIYNPHVDLPALVQHKDKYLVTSFKYRLEV